MALQQLAACQDSVDGGDVVDGGAMIYGLTYEVSLIGSACFSM